MARSIGRLAAAVGLALFASTTFGKEYVIQLARPDKPGTEFVVDVTLESRRNGELDLGNRPQPAGDEHLKATLHGTEKVIEVNDKTGQPTKVEVTVDSCEIGGTAAVAKGSLISVERSGGRKTILVNRQPVAPSTANLVAQMIPVDDPQSQESDDALIGTAQPQKVGDAWPINSGKMAKLLSDDGYPVEADKLKGTTKLADAKLHQGLELLTITVSMTADQIHKKARKGTAFQEGTLDDEETYVVATDPGTPVRETTETIHLKMSSYAKFGVKLGTSDEQITVRRVRTPKEYGGL